MENKLVGWREAKEKGMPKSGFGILVGRPKSAKTTLLADFPGAYVLELDEGDADHIDGRIEDIKDTVNEKGEITTTKLQLFRERLKQVVMDPSIKTIGIDTLDTLGHLFYEEILEKKGAPDGKFAWSDWADYLNKFKGLVEYINNCGKLVVFASHYKEIEKDQTGNILAAAKFSLPGQSGEYLAGRAKFIGYCYKEEIGGEQSYYVSFKGGPFAIWGSRIKLLNDKTIKLPEEKPYAAIEEALGMVKSPKQQMEKKRELAGVK